VDILADWALNPNTDETSGTTGADAAVNGAAGVWAAKSERIFLAFHFNFGGEHHATPIR
jgi:hypothetical protein